MAPPDTKTPVPAARPSRPSEIVADLRDRILKGELEPGTRLPPERELALSLGTNRNTLREALRALEAQGLIHARQGDGVRVLDFRQAGHLGLLPHYFRVAGGPDQARVLGDLLRFRSIVALEVVGLAARRAEAADVARLRGLVAEIPAALKGTGPRPLAEVELSLYRALTEASGSIAALWVLNGLEPVVRDLLDASPELWVVPEGYLESWEAITGALVARDADAARDALAALLDRADRRLLDLLDALESS
jgi:GntR family transcriptional regulator, transcriptional repressor for pyruvate dehydrogenase complex